MITLSQTKTPSFEAIFKLYKAVGWTNYTDNPAMLKSAIDHTTTNIFAYSDNQLVGILRAVGDGASIIFIQDIIVDPNYQRQGIGSDLIKYCLKVHKDVYQIHLLTDNTEKTRQFYEANGFISAEDIGCICYTRM